MNLNNSSEGGKENSCCWFTAAVVVLFLLWAFFFRLLQNISHERCGNGRASAESTHVHIHTLTIWHRPFTTSSPISIDRSQQSNNSGNGSISENSDTFEAVVSPQPMSTRCCIPPSFDHSKMDAPHPEMVLPPLHSPMETLGDALHSLNTVVPPGCRIDCNGAPTVWGVDCRHHSSTPIRASPEPFLVRKTASSCKRPTIAAAATDRSFSKRLRQLEKMLLRKKKRLTVRSSLLDPLD